jgi:outer membrane receptor protein involved in Fe transport
MFGDRGFRIGNPELRPEEGENLDLGLRLERNDPLAGVDRLLLEATVFRRDVTDLIRTVYDARGVGRSVNLDRAVFRGLEGVFGLQVGGHLRLEQTLTLQETRVSSPYRYEDGNVVPGHPAQAWSTRVELFGEPLEGLRATLFGEWRGDSGGFYDTANLIPRYEDFVMNAGVEARYGRFRATLEVKNVTDWNREGTIDDGVIHYGREETVGYPLPGRHFALHLACEF